MFNEITILVIIFLQIFNLLKSLKSVSLSFCLRSQLSRENCRIRSLPSPRVYNPYYPCGSTSCALLYARLSKNRPPNFWLDFKNSKNICRHKTEILFEIWLFIFECYFSVLGIHAYPLYKLYIVLSSKNKNSTFQVWIFGRPWFIKNESDLT